MTLDQISYLQRETLLGLHALGGTARRSEIAQAAKIDGLKTPNALSRLDALGLAEPGADRNWRITEAGYAMLAGHVVEAPAAPVRATAEPVRATGRSPLPEPPSDPDVRATADPDVRATGRSPLPQSPSPSPSPSPRDAMAVELRSIWASMPPFSVADAAWLCRALAGQLADTPTVSAMLGQMADYWETR